MESISILHCADLHLGASFSSLPPGVATERSNDLLRVFTKIIELCDSRKIQLLLIAGDLFDTIHVPEALTDMARNAFESIPSTFVAIAPGNHDPAVFDSLYRMKDKWPKNVYVFTNGLSYVDLPAMKVRLWGAGFTNIYQDKPISLVSKFTDTDLLNICVMHSELVSTGTSSAYNPITMAMIEESSMDYIALGHIHKRSEIYQVGSVFYAYPGSPEGLGFDEKGERGVYIGEVSRGFCDMHFCALNKRSYMDVHVDATGLQREEIIKQIRNMLRLDKVRAVDNLIRVYLTGTVTEDSYVSPEYATSVFSDVFYLALFDQTELSAQSDSSGHSFTLRNIYIRKMQEIINQKPDDEATKLALKLGLRAFSEKVIYKK